MICWRLINMFSAEGKAGEIVDKAIEKYELHFDLDFPLYTKEFLTLVANDKYDISLDGAKRLKKFINDRIKENKPVDVPEDYYDRIY